MFVYKVKLHMVKKPKIEKMQNFSNEKDIEKIPRDLNSRSLEEQFMTIRRKKIVALVGLK